MSTTPRLFDVHTHVQFHAFKNDADFVVRRAFESGVWMVNVGTGRGTSSDALRIAEQYTDGVYATVGLHPIHTAESFHDEQESDAGRGGSHKEKEFEGEEIFDRDFYKKLAVHEKVVAIGECGLDYYRIDNGAGYALRVKKQHQAFMQQLELACELNKPLMIHCRQAFVDLIGMLAACGRLPSGSPGIVHFFSGTKQDAAALLDLGFSFSFGGVITFARDYDDAVRYIPLDRVTIETDAPYVAPVPRRGKRNEPAYVAEIAKKIAELKGLSFEEVADRTTENAMSIFKIKSRC